MIKTFLIAFIVLLQTSTNLVTLPDTIEINKEFKIELINGLNYEFVTWVSSDTIIKTPKNLILNFTKKGEYTLHIRNRPQNNYKIKL